MSSWGWSVASDADDADVAFQFGISWVHFRSQEAASGIWRHCMGIAIGTR